ncbi:hypothetical protein HO173_004026 [Letharia columbiana]|uniref:Uncharacterized protein n=1 Tax=Letharia columbiana TaxID=112416 RepID=A0A8H6FZQ7_9LECA|nr:uncharacterized protein HO173_004026 [Letharia columbiana]KAF6237825.1 hypothetical protein HO173_004026 [Letharia columbiana]
MRERDGESGGENEVFSLQKAIMPENESEDVIMTDQAPIEGKGQSQQSDDTPDLQITSVRALRSASKRQKKTVENGKLKGEGYEAKAGSVEEYLANAALQLQSCQSNLEDAEKKLAASKEALKNTKAQLQSKKKDLAACKRKLKTSKHVGRDLKANNRDLQDCFTASQVELCKCKDDLFRMQTVTQIPDSAIVKRFECLSQQIVHWIDTQVAIFEKARPEANPDQIFLVGEDKYATTFLRLHPGAGEHLARYLIHRSLQDNVFGQKVYFWGLPEETAQLLWKAEQKMAEVEPPRDSVTIASWRSETLKALAKTTECNDYGKKRTQEFNSHLFKELGKTFPFMFSSREAHATFYDQVLLPAVKLANMIRISTSNYVFSIPESPITECKPVTTDLLKVHKMIDSKSGRQLKPDSAVVADKDGFIADIVICLEPGLYRVIKGKETTLRQITLLLELKSPLLAKRSKASA